MARVITSLVLIVVFGPLIKVTGCVCSGTEVEVHPTEYNSTELVIPKNCEVKFNNVDLFGVLYSNELDETLNNLNISVRNRLDDVVTFIFGPLATGTVKIVNGSQCANFALPVLTQSLENGTAKYQFIPKNGINYTVIVFSCNTDYYPKDNVSIAFIRLDTTYGWNGTAPKCYLLLAKDDKVDNSLIAILVVALCSCLFCLFCCLWKKKYLKSRYDEFLKKYGKKSISKEKSESCRSVKLEMESGTTAKGCEGSPHPEAGTDGGDVKDSDKKRSPPPEAGTDGGDVKDSDKKTTGLRRRQPSKQ